MRNAYTTNVYTYKTFKPTREKVIVGIDEAGRGPVLGHLVYGALIAKTVQHNFVDSKTISPAKRAQFFDVIQDNYAYMYSAIHPKFLSNQMLAGASLNEVSYSTVIDMLVEINSVYDIDTVVLDALGPNALYRQRLMQALPHLKYIIESKADTKYKIVGGASIIAKCTRDELLSNWRLKDREIGSGYPSDDVTIQWLRNNYNPVYGVPSIVRFSWRTIKNMFGERGGQRLSGRYNNFGYQR